MCLAPHPPPPMCGTPAQVALDPAHVWPRHLVMNLQMNRTTPLSSSQRSGHALPHSSFSLFNNEAQNGKGTQLQGPLGMRGGVWAAGETARSWKHTHPRGFPLPTIAHSTRPRAPGPRHPICGGPLGPHALVMGGEEWALIRVGPHTSCTLSLPGGTPHAGPKSSASSQDPLPARPAPEWPSVHVSMTGSCCPAVPAQLQPGPGQVPFPFLITRNSG